MILTKLNSFKKVCAALAIGIVCSGSIFAKGENMSAVYTRIDSSIARRSEKELFSVLSENSTKDDYSLIEQYTERKIRRLIVDNDFDFALRALTVILENNLENESAADTYCNIMDARKSCKNIKKGQNKIPVFLCRAY